MDKNIEKIVYGLCIVGIIIIFYLLIKFIIDSNSSSKTDSKKSPSPQVSPQVSPILPSESTPYTPPIPLVTIQTAPTQIPNTNEMINIIDVQPLPSPAPKPKASIQDYASGQCDIGGYDLSCESRNGRTDEDLMNECSNMKNCNSLVAIPDSLCFKNVPDNATCQYTPETYVKFYALKSKNITFQTIADTIAVAVAPIVDAIMPSKPKASIQDYASGQCDIGGYSLSCESRNGRTDEDLMNECSNMKDCNSLVAIPENLCFKNVPDNATCEYSPETYVKFYALKSKNLKYPQ